MAKQCTCPCSTGPSPWVMRWIKLAQKNAPVLDVACGYGRHTAALLLEGYTVTACDIDTSEIDRLRGEGALTVERRDLENAPWPYGPEAFGAIVVTNYLHRPLFPAFYDSLLPGGLVIAETFTRANGEIWGHPRNPEHFLEAGEFLRLMPEGARLLGFEEGMTANGLCISRIVFEKPGPVPAGRRPIELPAQSAGGLLAAA